MDFTRATCRTQNFIVSPTWRLLHGFDFRRSALLSTVAAAAMSLMSYETTRTGPVCNIMFMEAGCMLTGSTGAGPGCGSISPGACPLST